MKKTDLLNILCIAFLMTSCGSDEKLKPESKIGFIENGTVFEQFEMKKDYDKLLEKEMKNETALVDSLGVLLNTNAYTDSMQVFKLRKDYYIAKQLFSTKFEQLSGQYTNDVNERLNLYIEEYSKAEDYDFIFGSGQGNIMYVREKKNVTDELLKYINTKYKK